MIHFTFMNANFVLVAVTMDAVTWSQVASQIYTSCYGTIVTSLTNRPAGHIHSTPPPQTPPIKVEAVQLLRHHQCKDDDAMIDVSQQYEYYMLHK